MKSLGFLRFHRIVKFTLCTPIVLASVHYQDTDIRDLGHTKNDGRGSYAQPRKLLSLGHSLLRPLGCLAVRLRSGQGIAHDVPRARESVRPLIY
jgi:hypothetical protein